ncbi:MAG: hypothetical protein IKJ77_04530 [Firmicutes bacterium]|nr:hypothetical protein [Bacillota bacterium]
MKKITAKLSVRMAVLSLLIMLFCAQPVSADSSFELELVGTVGGDVNLTWENPCDWDAEFYGDTFYVQRKNAGSTEWQNIAEVEWDAWEDEFEYTDDTTAYGGFYEYRILARGTYYGDDEEIYEVSSTVETMDYTYIKAPEIKDVNASGSNYEVTWTAISGAAGYHIFSYNEKTDRYTLIGTVNDGSAESWVDTTPSTEIKRSYAMQSLGYADGVLYTSDYSDYASNITGTLDFGMTLSKTNTGNIKVTWTNPCDRDDVYYDSTIDLYTVYRKTSADNTWKKIGTREELYSEYEHTLIDKNVPYGVTATYMIVAPVASEDEDYETYTWVAASGEKSMKSAKAKAPKLKVSTTTSSKALKLSWNKVNGASGYEIYAANSKNGKYKRVKIIKSGKTTSWTHTGLKTGAKKYYKIKSFGKRNGKKYYSDFSGKVYKKVTKNQKTWSPSTSFDDYGGPVLRKKSVSYVNGKLQYKALVLNDRIFYANKFNWIRISIYADGKLIGQQKFYNKPINMDAYDMKYMTFTLKKGTKKVVNLRTSSISVEYQYNYRYTI